METRNYLKFLDVRSWIDQGYGTRSTAVRIDGRTIPIDQVQEIVFTDDEFLTGPFTGDTIARVQCTIPAAGIYFKAQGMVQILDRRATTSCRHKWIQGEIELIPDDPLGKVSDPVPTPSQKMSPITDYPNGGEPIIVYYDPAKSDAEEQVLAEIKEQSASERQFAKFKA